MNCSHAQILIHALLDNELDAGHATDVAAHVGSCAACSERLAAFEIMRKVLGRGDLMEVAPVPLRKRLQLVPSPLWAGGQPLQRLVAGTLIAGSLCAGSCSARPCRAQRRQPS